MFLVSDDDSGGGCGRGGRRRDGGGGGFDGSGKKTKREERKMKGLMCSLFQDSEYMDPSFHVTSAIYPAGVLHTKLSICFVLYFPVFRCSFFCVLGANRARHSYILFSLTF
jgi:hypothetical protein